MKKDNTTLILKVKDSLSEDASRAIARIDTEDMESLGMEVGEIIEVEGKRRTVAKVMPCYAEDRGKNIIRLDGISRENSWIGLDEKVKIHKISYKLANKITLSPLTVSSLLKKNKNTKHSGSFIEGLPVIAGDRVRATLFGLKSCDFKVEDTIPDGVVLVGPATLIRIESKETEESGALKVSYKDIGGLRTQIQRIREMIELPLKYPHVFKRLRIDIPKGVFLYGPPGTGKTLLAEAIANESGINFISIKGPELISPGAGESEREVREVFKKAKQTAPTILFLDEIDSLVPRRGSSSTDSHEGMISQFLIEMDRVEELKGVVVLGATNRLDLVEPALLRSGRFDFLLEFPVPDEDTRLEIFNIHTKNKPLAGDVDLRELAKKTGGKVGSDIEFICQKASILAIREYKLMQMAEDPLRDKTTKVFALPSARVSNRVNADKELSISKRHFEEAMKLVMVKDINN